MSNTIKQGEVYIVDFGVSVGATLQKPHPALVISNDNSNFKLSTIVVVPITAFQDRLHKHEILLRKGIAQLRKDSRLKLHQITTVDRKQLLKKIGELDRSQMVIVRKTMLQFI